MESRVDKQHNKVFHLEDSTVMYCIYNSDTLDDLICTVHMLHDQSTWNERLFAGQIKDWYHWYLSSRGIIQLPLSVKIPFRNKYRLRYLEKKISIVACHVKTRNILVCTR